MNTDFQEFAEKNEGTFNKMSMQTIRLFSDKHKNSKEVDKQFMSILLEKESLSESYINKLNEFKINELEQKIKLYKEYTNLKLRENILKIKVGSHKNSEAEANRIQRKIDELKEQLKSFPYKDLELINITTKDELDKLLDQIESDSEKFLRNLNQNYIPLEMRSFINDARRLSKVDIFDNFMDKFISEFKPFKGPEFDEEILSFLSNEFKKTKQSDEDGHTQSLLQMTKDIYNNTFSKQIKIMKGGLQFG